MKLRTQSIAQTDERKGAGFSPDARLFSEVPAIRPGASPPCDGGAMPRP